MDKLPVEVLSPAGDPEKLRTAIAFGADAVYLSGKTFGLRTFSGNFSHEEMAEAIAYAHSRNVKCYVTMNIMADEADIDVVDEEIKFIDSVGADAVIVSDAGIFRKVRKLAPNLEIHISTQASVTNSEGCMFWYEAGARRVVLAREVSLEQIREIRSKIPADLELECFIHGAMCVSYSGRCLLSSFFTGRSANKGSCAQPCRWGYTVAEEKRLNSPLPVEEDERGTYIFNSKDICMIDHIPELIKAGVNSFKIEGRIKGAYYAAAVTKIYKEAVTMFFENPESYSVQPRWHELLEKVVHRDYATGFFFDRPSENAQIVYDKSYNKPAFVVAVTLDFNPETGLYHMQQRNKVFRGDTVNVLSPDGWVDPFIISELYSEDMLPIESTPHSLMNYYMKPNREISMPPMSFISRDGDKDGGVTPNSVPSV